MKYFLNFNPANFAHLFPFFSLVSKCLSDLLCARPNEHRFDMCLFLIRRTRCSVQFPSQTTRQSTALSQDKARLKPVTQTHSQTMASLSASDTIKFTIIMEQNKQYVILGQFPSTLHRSAACLMPAVLLALGEKEAR